MIVAVVMVTEHRLGGGGRGRRQANCWMRIIRRQNHKRLRQQTCWCLGRRVKSIR